MKISLYLNDKIVNFFLPPQVSGSYSFDANPDEETKLINVEARNNTWTLYSTPEIEIYYDNQIVNEVPLTTNAYIHLKRNNQNFLISTASSTEELKAYNYDKNSKIIIGNNNQCTITFPCDYIGNTIFEIKKINGQIVLNSTNQQFLYVNNKSVKSNQMIINFGDKINLLNFKIIVLSEIIIINNPSKIVNVNIIAAQLKEFKNQQEEYKDLEIKDEELYKKEEYFTKSPRMRRIIEEKTIKLDAPPKPKDSEKLPLILTIGPMLSMGVTSSMMLLNTIMQISNGQTTIDRSWLQLVSSSVMLLTSLVWPLLTRLYNKHLDRESNKKLYQKYIEYLDEKKADLEKEKVYQKSILTENLITNFECLKIINNKSNNFWDKRKDQDDFLEVRVGIGKFPLKVKIEYPEEGFTIEESNLRKAADAMVEEYKYIENVPVSYSLYEKYLTGILGKTEKCQNFIDNILIQLMTYYCYDELKIMIFTDDEKKDHWKYLKFSNYNISNDKSIRYFATNIEDAKKLCDDLSIELNNRISGSENTNGSDFSPYYLIICENYKDLKKLNFFKTLTEMNKNIGYSTIVVDRSLGNLPSKCVNFINLADGISGILKNSYENQEVINFKDEIDNQINMMEITRILSNIPVEIEKSANQLPNAITFLEMEKVGKVEQLNILNRWNSNDSTTSLKAEVGVDVDGNLMYLDLHEKYHGPHGLIAGMTGSGKSEFIITYILSMAMNYSPDDVAFILIDYKGGGLAFAFENKLTNVMLPHLAGTITNLDKAEMDRTLVSIDSEVKRRQAVFNSARDQLGESTIDIYKYQKFYHEGKLNEAVPHLFLIADEFAELKSQQPDFMDNLISIARIGRSLGVHLILATQKPSGVVNDQIWSNTKFRVCLKVQDESDSKEMLKRPDAASLKQTGRFYLQVGFDEYFALGQSGWCGAKYYPSEKIVKNVDKSINFIDNIGIQIKSIQASNDNAKKEAKGEQLAAIMKEIINVASQTNKKARRLWLENIPETILIDELEKKYQVEYTPYNVESIIGEYDAPEKQEQGIVKYNFLDNGNTIIYGMDGGEKEKLLTTIIYSTVKHHTADEINFYIMDYGSESLRSLMSLPHIGGMVFTGEDEKYNNLLKLIQEEQKERKQAFIEYGGEYKNYIKNSSTKKPIEVVIINNYDSLYENNPNVLDEIPELLRDSERYGIVFILTANSTRSIHSKINQNCQNIYALRQKDNSDFSSMFSQRTKIIPRDMLGRGLYESNGEVHEFQTASIVDSIDKQNDFLINFVKEVKQNNTTIAKPIPSLPEHLTFDYIEKELVDMKRVPFGMSKNTLELLKADLVTNIGTMISSNKLDNTKNFTRSLITELNKLNMGIIFLDPQKLLPNIKTQVANYYTDKFEDVLDALNTYLDKQIETPTSTTKVTIIFNGIYKILSKISGTTKLDNLMDKIKKYEKISVILIEEASKLKNYNFDSWFKSIFSQNDGLWIGKGMSDQQIFKYSNYNKEMTQEYKNDMGYFITEGTAELCKIIDFYPDKGDEESAEQGIS